MNGMGAFDVSSMGLPAILSIGAVVGLVLFKTVGKKA